MRFLLLFLLGTAYAEEPTIYQISQAIAQIETGAHWDGKKGKAGEVGRYQILPVVLRERGCSSAGSYRDFQRVFLYFLVNTNDWKEACAAYHRGLGGIHKKAAKEYAQAVANLVSIQR